MKTLQKMPMMALIRPLKVSLLILSGETWDIVPISPGETSGKVALDYLCVFLQ